MKFTKTQMAQEAKPVQIVVKITDNMANTRYHYPRDMTEAMKISESAVGAGFLVTIEIDPAQEPVEAKYAGEFSEAEVQALLLALHCVPDDSDSIKLIRQMTWNISKLAPAK